MSSAFRPLFRQHAVVKPGDREARLATAAHSRQRRREVRRVSIVVGKYASLNESTHPVCSLLLSEPREELVSLLYQETCCVYSDYVVYRPSFERCALGICVLSM